MSQHERVRVLFVCMGNICRSPTAEGVFRHVVGEAGLAEAVEIDSAGTYAYHVGEPPDPRSHEEAAKHGIDLGGIRARKVRAGDFEHYDYIVAMDEQNLADLRALCPGRYQSKLYRMCEFAGGCGVRSVPDPYYGGPDGFGKVFRLIEQGSLGLLEHIKKDLKDGGRRAQSG
jgi:protein-tyrosine phosphatase